MLRNIILLCFSQHLKLYNPFLVLKVYNNSLEARLGLMIVCQSILIFVFFIQQDFIFKAWIKSHLVLDVFLDHPSLLLFPLLEFQQLMYAKFFGNISHSIISSIINLCYYLNLYFAFYFWPYFPKRSQASWFVYLFFLCKLYLSQARRYRNSEEINKNAWWKATTNL